MRKNILCRLEKLDYALMVDPFRFRTEDDGAWRCEFWGKVVRSAILAWRLEPSSFLLEKIRDTVKDLLSTQTTDGCISTYPADKQISGWDIWGRKYVLLALLRYYRLIEASPEILDACCRMVDHLLSQLTGERADLRACGMHDGLASCSILGGIVELYEATGEKRYLDFAHRLIESGCSLKENVFDAALKGVPPKGIGNAKAYELTSCFKGAAAYSRMAGEEKYKTCVEKYFRMVAEQEIFVTGTAGGRDDCGEFWFDGVINQTCEKPGCGLGETCVTATWLHLCESAFSLDWTDPAPFDQMETSLYNAILGAMSQSGDRWTHVNPTPLTGGGWKESPPDQIRRWFNTPFDEHDCCRAQGPEGLAFGAAHAVLRLPDGFMVNFYEDFLLENTTSSGAAYTVENSGAYLTRGVTELFFKMKCPTDFKAVLRIPAWSKKCEVFLNEEKIAVCAGKYCIIDRVWSDGDHILIDFHPDVDVVYPNVTSGYFALKYGPVVLAEPGKATTDPDPCGNWEICSTGRGRILNVKQGNFTACDYASAGSAFSPDDPLRVFFPSK
ncbi:MAG: hypothetical protein GX946_02580 [Oligosphaeraceae bacterium]|nr:hypothetical protein [Oligosphaeraceae bacterium]